MSALLTLDQVSLATPDGRPLFSDLTLAVGRERVGLVGRNGAGKSTLLRAIAGDVAPLRGVISVTGRMAVLRQMSSSPSGDVAALLDVAQALDRLARIERGVASDQDFEAADWMLPDRIDAALAGIGMPGADLSRPVASFSGGERMRLAIAGLLLSEPELIVLDEPTNDLDRSGRAAVHDLLLNWRGGLIVASHDRELLEGVDRIVELSPVRVLHFGGGWSAFSAARDLERQQALSAVEHAEMALRSYKREAQAARERQMRRDSAGRSFAKSGSAPRIAMGLAKRRAEATSGKVAQQGSQMVGEAQISLDDARQKVERVTPLSIDLQFADVPSTRTLLTLEEVTIEQGGARLFAPLTLAIRGPERIALQGPNGVGKSSLLNLIRGGLEPSSGTVSRHGRIAHLDQHVGLLDPGLSVLDNLRKSQPELSDHAAHAVLARFAFRNRDALKLVSTLSGGERLRAGMACAMPANDPPHLLMLDEPTNHLDLDSIEILEQALCAFGGALILVSHDASFLRAVGMEREIWLEKSGMSERA